MDKNIIKINLRYIQNEVRLNDKRNNTKVRKVLIKETIEATDYGAA